MLKKTYILFLFLLQCLLVVNGRNILGRDGNPFVLFIISLSILVLFLYVTFRHKEDVQTVKAVTFSLDKRVLGFILGCLPIILLKPVISNMFHEFPDFANSSDVIPQLEALYTRWRNGIFPYYPLEQFSWHPYPVYMPLNWLPVGISYILHIDVRWTGIILLMLANGIWGWYLWGSAKALTTKLAGILLPVIPLCFYMKWARFDISVSLETIIAAYYLVLATGLASRNIWITTAGIILCLLSRYTMIFWLPLFAVLLFLNRPIKISFIVWGSVIIAILIIFVIPFYLKDPTILVKGITYHNNCAIDEWKGYGDDKMSWTFEAGLYFAPYLKQLITSGTMEHRVYIARIIQAILMLGICVGGIIFYIRNKAKINMYDFSLAALYLIVLFFYQFSPLLYKYYLIVLLVISAVLCFRIYLANASKRPADT